MKMFPNLAQYEDHEHLDGAMVVVVEERNLQGASS